RDEQRLRQSRGRKTAERWRDVEAGQLGRLGEIGLGALGDPALQGFGVGAVEVEALAAFVRDLPGGFLHKQAVRRFLEVEAAASGATRQADVVVGRIVATQGDLEAFLARSGPVAGAAVAPSPGQDRHDVVREAYRPGVDALHADRYFLLDPWPDDGDLGLSHALGHHD